MADSDNGNRRMARAIFRACAVPDAVAPYDRVTLKIFYPAIPDDSEEQRNAGVIAADRDAAPCPVIIIMPGINVGPEAYAWLARELALSGTVVVTYSMIAEEMPGYVSLTPGLDLAAITPETYGTRPSATAIGAIIEALKAENSAGILAGCIDIGSIVLLGHSAGGSVAIYNANPAWFPELKGAIAYGAHAAASTALGFAENTVLTLPDDLPIVLLGGSNDGVIANSAHRYGDQEDAPPDRLLQTFEKGLRSNRGDSYLLQIAGANHFSIAYPLDESTGRHFLDGPQSTDGVLLRALLRDVVESFVLDACKGGDRMAAFADHGLVSVFERR